MLLVIVFDYTSSSFYLFPFLVFPQATLRATRTATILKASKPYHRLNPNMPPIQKKVHINVDLGEGYGNFKAGPDDELVPLIDHANIACGVSSSRKHHIPIANLTQIQFHAGDPLIMQDTVAKCKQHNILIGAHPGLPDIQGFGRREIKMSPEELTAMVRYQVGALQGFLSAAGVALNHVKPHGVLYGMMYRDRDICKAVYEGVPPGTRVFGLAGTFHEDVAKELGLPFTAEL